MSEHVLGISEADFWKDPSAGIREAESNLAGKFEEALLIDGPTSVDLQLRSTAPLWALYAAPVQTLSTMRVRDLICVVASSPDLREVRVETLPDPPQRLPPPLEPPDEPLEGYSVEVVHNDLRRRLGIPWQPARWIVRALMFNKQSNTMELRLGSPALFHDDAVDEYIERARSVPRAPAIWPPMGHPLPVYGIVHGAPLPPDSEGIALACRRVMVTHPGQPAVLFGSFRLRIPRRFTVPPPERPPIDGYAPPTAVVPIDLVITSSASAGFIHGPLRVPCYEPIDPNERYPVVTGQFAIDLFRLEGFDTTPQTHFIHAFHGEHMTGPTLMALIDPAAVPE